MLNILNYDIGFDWCANRQYLEKNIILSHLKNNYDGFHRNFEIVDITCKDIMKPLFDIFFEISKNNFKLRENNPNYKFWAFVSNKNRNSNILHDHRKTAICNGVFYLKIPETKNKNEGGLLIKKSFSSNEETIFKFKDGNLIIFPATYPHKPLPIYTEDYRIAINMEIL